MIKDLLAVFSDAQTTTTSAASTDYIDTLVAGDAYVGNWFVGQIDTVPTITNGQPSLLFQLQTSAESSFTDVTSVTLIASVTYISSQLTAGKFFAARIPLGVKRYLRGYTVKTANFAALAYDMYIVKDLDTDAVNKRYRL